MLGGPVSAAALVLIVVTVSYGRSYGECEFPDRECGWNWSEGWNLLSAQNITSPGFGTTAPAADAQNNVKGLFLYWSADDTGDSARLEIESPVFEAHTLPTCALQMSLHMWQMNLARFQVVIKAPNSTWESTRFEGSSAHEWELKTEPIGLLSQPFQVILEILIGDNAPYPSHVAVDDIELVRCYDRKVYTTDCRPRQFQCYDLICIEGSEVCDITQQCTQGEDEEQECDKIPEAGYCNFENGMCGWYNNETDKGKWVLHRGEDGTNIRTGPTVDHTYRNKTGAFLMAKFSSGRAFGHQATFTSPWFKPIPYYHRNVHSAYYNTCNVRFYFHKFGANMGELRLYSQEVDSNSQKLKVTSLWRSYGNKGDVWWNAVVPLPNMTNIYQLQFVASRGMGQSDISIDDLSLSPKCFGIGVPVIELGEPTTEPSSSTERIRIQRYEFGTCGAHGRFGPNETLCLAAYRDTSTKVVVMNEPSMEGVQKWIVPESGLYTVFVKGAGGGNGVMWREEERSMGTSIRATFDWDEGETVYILVGQKGTSVCDEQKPLCAAGISKEMDPKFDALDVLKQMRNKDAGGGGGGATFLFTVDPVTHNRHPIAIAGGGGGLAARVAHNDSFINTSPHGLPPNASILPINGYTGSGAGGGGGWDDNTAVSTAGWSLREGGRGGESCNRHFDSDGGFGGGGGGCQSGGGGGGYRGGDAPEVDNPYHNGQGGTSFLHAGAIRVLVEPGSNPGDGSLIILPAQQGCGCEYRCVYLDLQYVNYYCICPPHLTINIDGFSCNGHSGVAVTPKVLVAIIVTVVLVIVVIAICIFFGWTKYRKLNEVSRDISDEPLTNPDEQLSRLRSSGGMISENNPNYEFGGNTCTEQDLKKVSREHLTLVKPLGQGAFGEVYEGQLLNPADNSYIPVAVKTLPELSSSQAVLDFLMEALIMSKFNHPNIVSFIGVCFDKMPRFIVLELLPGGDLKSFLRECRPKPNKPSTLTISDLLRLAIDVAKGCQYLEENHFIHRDIAARNCLLTTKDANRVVKIADFGMARDIYRADYYRKGGKAMLPVKWMPPEAFLDGIFTSKTDIWSFGVLLWEVFSLGYMPYPGRGNQEVMQIVTSGSRLEPPTNCPGPLYHIMMQCWRPHPEERPNFTTIIERLGYCLQDPDVINAPLPVFNRAPSMERDATVMRPVDDENEGCLQVQRPDPCLLLSPGSEDYLIPNQQSSYSLTTDLQSSPSQGSADQLLELEDRSKSPRGRGSGIWETNFINPDPTNERKNRISHPPMKRQDGYTEVPTDETEGHVEEDEDSNEKIQRNGYVASGARANAKRMSSIKSLDDLPIAPRIGENENNLKTPDNNSSKHRSNLSLDPSALVRQISGGDPTNLPPNRYVNVDVNCNTGDSNSSLSRMGLENRNSVTGPFDGYSGVNPVA